MQTILVTGGNGLLGRYVVHSLKDSYNVIVVDIKQSRTHPAANVRYVEADVLDLERMTEHSRGADAVIHLAAIPHPLNDPPQDVVRLNVMGTFTMLEAAARCGIRKFVYASSESTLGFAFAAKPASPLYIPVDEDHPLQPQDPYGMSKLLGEEMCASYTRRYGMQTLCLRMPWIWIPEPEEQAFYRTLISEYPKWYKNLWAFVHGLDAAQAFRLCAHREHAEEHRAWYITAETNWTGRDARELAHEFYPAAGIRSSLPHGPASLISNSRAKAELGFTPSYSVQDVFEGEYAV